MGNVVWWLGASYACAFLLMVAAVAALSLSEKDTAQMIDRDVRR